MGKMWSSLYCGHADFVVKTDDDIFIDLYETYVFTRCKNICTGADTGLCSGGDRFSDDLDFFFNNKPQIGHF